MTGAEAKREISEMEEAVLRTRNQQVPGREIETIGTFWFECCDCLRGFHQAQCEVGSVDRLDALVKHRAGNRRLLGFTLLPRSMRTDSDHGNQREEDKRSSHKSSRHDIGPHCGIEL